MAQSWTVRFSLKSGEETEIGTYGSRGEAEDAIQEHHDDQFYSGEDMGDLDETPPMFGNPLGGFQPKAAFLKDVVAMANADGGIIVYGMREGRGERAGVAVALDGISGSIDDLSNLIDNLLRNNTDERISVLHRDISLSEGKFAYLS